MVNKIKKVSLAKMFFTAIAVWGFCANVCAQQINEVTLTVSGDGVTKEEATKSALRSAIEQSFGVFVSANTTILNDELVKDEIATVSSGNIKQYEEIAIVQMPDGKINVTLKAIVSVSKLITYSQSKGSTAEFAGATFGMNMKLKELNKANEEKAIANMISQLKALIPIMFDYKIELGEPVISGERTPSGRIIKGDENFYDIPAKVSIIFNNHTEMANNILLRTLRSLSLPTTEVEEYKKLGIDYAHIDIANFHLSSSAGKKLFNVKFKKPLSKYADETRLDDIVPVGKLTFVDFENNYYGGYYLRSKESIQQLNTLNVIFNESVYNFKIESNTGVSSSINEGLISSYDSPILGGKYNLGGYTISYDHQRYWVFAYGNRPIDEDGRDRNINICIPHLYKDRLAMYKGNLVPYILNLILTIPKEDIMKYNNFTITHK
ncbi:MAG: hypothetical protein LBI60_01670 [Bacteroidales bacterium]|jgi:hypothetical protein|nr:hypothetical protein [Bacteroidales bacterium]